MAHILTANGASLSVSAGGTCNYELRFAVVNERKRLSRPCTNRDCELGTNGEREEVARLLLLPS